MSTNIAMWSGPRNISTAMMRAWENRPDCAVWDEPLYAAYLRDTGLDHPMRAAILAHYENDWEKVIDHCVADAPDGNAIYYQKHMTHHVLPHYSNAWLEKLQHCFLLRHPRDVLLSYSQKRENATLSDIGIIQQLALFEAVSELHGQPPLIFDAQHFLARPEAYLNAVCAHFSIAFYPSMLSWPAGQRESDGIWGEHWYANVWQTTGFGQQQPQQQPSRHALDKSLLAVLEAAMPAYEKLLGYCLIL